MSTPEDEAAGKAVKAAIKGKGLRDPALESIVDPGKALQPEDRTDGTLAPRHGRFADNLYLTAYGEAVQEDFANRKFGGVVADDSLVQRPLKSLVDKLVKKGFVLEARHIPFPDSHPRFNAAGLLATPLEDLFHLIGLDPEVLRERDNTDWGKPTNISVALKLTGIEELLLKIILRDLSTAKLPLPNRPTIRIKADAYSFPIVYD